MEVRQRDDIKMKILEGEKLYRENGRFMRLRKRPLRMLSHYTLNAMAMIKPFTVRLPTLWGDTMRIYLPDSGVLYLKGYHEANVANLFVNLLEDGDVFLDIGAHVGFYSMLASSLVGDRGSVIGIEPTPRTYGLLLENTSVKGNVTVYNTAALNEVKEIEFYDYGPRYSALNSTGKDSSRLIPYRITAESIRMNTATIDELCKTHAIEPTVVKIDAEGAERLILEGMSSVLDDVRPLVIMEVAGTQFNESWGHHADESVQYLHDKGYECLKISESGVTSCWTGDDGKGVENLLFVHPGNRDRIARLVDKYGEPTTARPDAQSFRYLSTATSSRVVSGVTLGVTPFSRWRATRSRST